VGRVATVDVVLRGVAANRGGESLTHRALLYGSEEEFLAGIVPFIRDGLECGDPIRVTTTDRNTGWLRAALGADAGYVVFGESSQRYGIRCGRWRPCTAPCRRRVGLGCLVFSG